MKDPTEKFRRGLVADINSNPRSREDLKALYGDVYDTDELRETFTVQRFLAPFVFVTRRSDGARGSVMFQHAPRLYYWFSVEERKK